MVQQGHLKKSAQIFLSFQFALRSMANELNGIKYAKAVKVLSFQAFSLLPKRPNMQRLSLLSNYISFFSSYILTSPPFLRHPLIELKYQISW